MGLYSYDAMGPDDIREPEELWGANGPDEFDEYSHPDYEDFAHLRCERCELYEGEVAPDGGQVHIELYQGAWLCQICLEHAHEQGA